MSKTVNMNVVKSILMGDTSAVASFDEHVYALKCFLKLLSDKETSMTQRVQKGLRLFAYTQQMEVTEEPVGSPEETLYAMATVSIAYSNQKGLLAPLFRRTEWYAWMGRFQNLLEDEGFDARLKTLMKSGELEYLTSIVVPELHENTVSIDRLLHAVDSNNVLELAICLPSEDELRKLSLSLNQLLFRAVEAGSIDLVDILIEKGADVNTPLKEESSTMGGNIILAKALRSDNSTEMLRKLLDHGADPSLVDDNGNNSLHWAAWQTKQEVWPLLLDTGADLNARNKRGELPIHRAAFCENWPTVGVLIKAGSDINVPKSDGDTILHMACAGIVADLSNVIPLVEIGADVGARNNDGKTPADVVTDHRIKAYLERVSTPQPHGPAR